MTQKYAGYFSTDRSLPMLLALLRYFEATEHLFHHDDEPRTGYEYDDDADAWEAMARSRIAARAMITDTVKRRQPDG